MYARVAWVPRRAARNAPPRRGAEDLRLRLRIKVYRIIRYYSHAAVPFARYRIVLVQHHLLPTVSDESSAALAAAVLRPLSSYLPTTILRPLSGCVWMCVLVCVCSTNASTQIW